MKVFVNLLIIFIVFSNHLMAQVLETKIKLDGTASFIVAPKGAKRVIFYGIASDNSTSRVGIEIVGPKALKIKAKSAFIKNFKSILL